MISKGRTNVEADIDFMYEVYNSLIDRIELSYNKDIQEIENIVQSIEKDTTIMYEEKVSILQPYFENLDNLNQQKEKSQIALFCGIYSYWEKSLCGLCKYYKIEFHKKNGDINYAPKISDYLTELLNGQLIAHIPKVLLTEFDELRNFFTHGTLSPQRKSVIKNISKKNFISIHETESEFVFESISELHKTLEIIYKTLKNILSYRQNY